MMITNVVGNLGKEAKSREANERKYITFNMCSTSWKGGKKESTWVTVFYRDAPNLLPRLTKGAKVSVWGELKISTPEKDGQKYVDVVVYADYIELCDGKQEQVEQPQIQKNDRLFPDNDEFPF